MIVVKENYVIKIPSSMDLAKAAPLLCAGITTYSPLKYFKINKPQDRNRWFRRFRSHGFKVCIIFWFRCCYF